MTTLRSVASRLRVLFTRPRDDAGFSENHDQRGLPFVETIARDIRYALRTFRRSPGFVVAVVLSLALGIGVNSAIFTVLNALMLRSLPVRNPQELFIALPQDAAGLPPAGPARSPLQFSYPMFERLRRSAPGPRHAGGDQPDRTDVPGCGWRARDADDGRSAGIGGILSDARRVARARARAGS